MRRGLGAGGALKTGDSKKTLRERGQLGKRCWTTLQGGWGGGGWQLHNSASRVAGEIRELGNFRRPSLFHLPFWQTFPQPEGEHFWTDNLGCLFVSTILQRMVSNRFSWLATWLTNKTWKKSSPAGLRFTQSRFGVKAP